MTNTLIASFSAPEQHQRKEVDRSQTNLLVLLHGYQSNEMDLLALSASLPTGWEAASLRAPIPLGFGFAWFDLRGDLAAGEILFDPAQIQESAELVEQWVQENAEGYASVGLLGFSQGMAVATAAYQRCPERFSCIVGLSGFWGGKEGSCTSEKTPIFWGRGLSDPVIAQELIEDVELRLKGRGNTRIETYPGLGHAVNAQELADINDFLGNCGRQ